jgi:hypothetical protein
MYRLEDSMSTIIVTYNHNQRVWQGFVNCTIGADAVMERLIRQGYLKITPAHQITPTGDYNYETDEQDIYVPLHNVYNIK